MGGIKFGIKYFLLQRLEAKQVEELKKMKPSEVVPNSNYKDKYVHLIGQDSAIEAAKRTKSNKNYGFGKFDQFKIHSKQIFFFIYVSDLFSVPSANKRDVRSIEAVQADLKAKKKMKLSQAATATSIAHEPNQN